MSSGGASNSKPKAVPGWIGFAAGGLGSMGAACFTHPLDSLKVRFQLRNSGDPLFAAGENKVRGLYRGVTASLARQATYSTARFGIYGSLRDLKAGGELTGIEKVAAGLVAGSLGAIVGCPCDVTLVRMQADGKLPVEQQRNYKHIGDGLVRIARDEGVGAWFSGVSPLIVRGALMTIGQLSTYDQIKSTLIKDHGFADVPTTHFGASMVSSLFATLITSPADVVKTRMMQAKAGEYSGSMDCVRQTLKSEGPGAFFRGITAYYFRLGPHTILQLVMADNLSKLLAAKCA